MSRKTRPRKVFSFDLAAHAPELAGMGIPRGHQGGALGHSSVAAAQDNPEALGLAHQNLQRLQIQTAVGRMSDILRLHRGIDGDPLETAFFHRPGFHRRLDTRRQHLFHTLRSDALAPAGHRRGIDRQPVLEKLKAAEILPIGVLDPTFDRLLVGQIVHVLEVMQPDQQPRRLGRTANRLVMLAKDLIERTPRHDCGQTDQRMIHVDDRL